MWAKVGKIGNLCTQIFCAAKSFARPKSFTQQNFKKKENNGQKNGKKERIY